ncbi:MAG: hypothetical protein GXY48_04635 [Methanomicrobiales archaeon]|nr:hypothetical protein [Methanomicrobiales archaeon]
MKGIIAASYPKEHWFILSDLIGCIRCSAARINTKTLKVIFSGDIPSKHETVLASGKHVFGHITAEDPINQELAQKKVSSSLMIGVYTQNEFWVKKIQKFGLNLVTRMIMSYTSKT